MGGREAVETSDPVRLLLLAARTEAALRTRLDLNDHLACCIAERIGELFSD